MVTVSDTVEVIVSYLEPPHLCACSLVNQRWNAAAVYAFIDCANRIIHQMDPAQCAAAKLADAQKSLSSLRKAHIDEVKRFNCPPKTVAQVAAAVAILFGLRSDWGSCRKMLSAPDFLMRILQYNTAALTTTPTSPALKLTFKQLRPIVTANNFTVAHACQASFAAGGLCRWVLACWDLGHLNADPEIVVRAKRFLKKQQAGANG
eukprot:TRINITY_DN114402_c0_g1_i1.p2 TRINITY_DN114402_c0_g1~~TRINITY_DN114402_c0_g1_i1.p2  ORF type:complete len:205 (-),score=17.34 TRINITY_DN114402_c0_g1_i1:93-707(-)